MSRPCCQGCGLHPNICVCDACEPVANRTPVTILQHPSEVGRAKGTVRIAARCLKNLRVIPGETPDDFRAAGFDPEELDGRTALLFPGPESQPLESANLTGINQWLVLDGTWRKAAKLVHLNPALDTLPRFHLANPPASRYIIRKAPADNHLATTEAIAYLLRRIEPDLDTTPLDHAMSVLVDRLLNQMPPEFQRLYR